MYYAEFDTDKYIRENYFPNVSYKGVMVEVGSGPPEFISMSKHFRDSGWRCVCIDPNPKFVKQHKEVNSEIYQFACSFEDKESLFKIVDSELDYHWEDKVNGVSISALELRLKSNKNLPVEEIPVSVRKLNTILEEIKIENIDILSIDVEGWELEVLIGLDVDKYKPKVVVLENITNYNDLWEYDIPTDSWNKKKLDDIPTDIYTDYMGSVGYKLDASLVFNYIYIKK